MRRNLGLRRGRRRSQHTYRGEPSRPACGVIMTFFILLILSLALYATCRSAVRRGCWAFAAGGGPRPEGRRAVGWPTRTLAHRRPTASTASLPTERPKSMTGCGRSVGPRHAAQSIVQLAGAAPGRRRRSDGRILGQSRWSCASSPRESMSPTHSALISPNRNTRPGRHGERIPMSLGQPYGGLQLPLRRNRSSGLDCFTLDRLGARQPDFAVSQPRFTAYANTPRIETVVVRLRLQRPVPLDQPCLQLRLTDT